MKYNPIHQMTNVNMLFRLQLGFDPFELVFEALDRCFDDNSDDRNACPSPGILPYSFEPTNITSRSAVWESGFFFQRLNMLFLLRLFGGFGGAVTAALQIEMFWRRPLF
jgi:hypothetical protein